MVPASGSMQLGSRVHQAFEADFKTGRQHGLMHWLRQVYGAELLVHALYADEIMAEQRLAETMVEGYVQWAAETGLDEGIEVIAAEQDVQVPMPRMNGITLRGRLDQIIRRTRDGAVLFRDWKTTGNLNSAIHDLALSVQPRFYTMLQRLSSEDTRVEGGQFVYLLRSKRTSRASPPFYAAEEVRYNRETLNATYLRTKRAITEMMRARAWLKTGGDHREVVYQSPGADCSWACPFVTMCPLMDSGDRWQDMAKGEFIQEDPYAYYDRKPAA